MTPNLILYGVPLSQPFRSVSWLLLLNGKRFRPELAVPGMKSRVGSQHDSFLSMTNGRTSRVPLLRDMSFNSKHNDNGLTLAESPAIMAYLSERYGWCDNWYGKPGSERKANVDWYMHWHHQSTRSLARLLFPHFRPDLDKKYNGNENNKSTQKKNHKLIYDSLQTLNDSWLSSEGGEQEFLTKDGKPSIADLLAYEEIVGPIMLGLLPNLTIEYPNVSRWTDQMKQIPFHTEVHVALDIVASIVKSSPLYSPSTQNNTSMAKQMSRATKEGMASLVNAQINFAQNDDTILSSKL
mmetsp:Transcript_8845/g.12583  ORF Transcript_8845/g.12583 Transcript_8845/m.12583 type:complete len:295 (-) Transcript_8845:173-1057(-)|eukprot:CAMPEP_0184870688 /NCGR_PEP_ID=MMETSP0580-20130426/38443_1 /TAXON_ID=1118495 /ORGANISM="Dactyliosolen fragilissimus" /LENGTH=294 /DNA_ID=CAMNT_0027372915 /DNA_START=52 /DNA_END=936 /DNA_ORIENTATION=+